MGYGIIIHHIYIFIFLFFEENIKTVVRHCCITVLDCSVSFSWTTSQSSYHRFIHLCVAMLRCQREFSLNMFPCVRQRVCATMGGGMMPLDTFEIISSLRKGRIENLLQPGL